ncbi:hypothetical protein Mapa_007751 [Marchantia paleacea]|nr:hypothetical protein Mapa_007751 [Marchantia paleacea]
MCQQKAVYRGKTSVHCLLLTGGLQTVEASHEHVMTSFQVFHDHHNSSLGNPSLDDLCGPSQGKRGPESSDSTIF